jgi:hypothetical protein
VTWSITFEVDQGKLDPDTLRLHGGSAPPDGTITVSGYQADQGRSIGVGIAGANVSGYFPNQPPAPSATDQATGSDAVAQPPAGTGG